MAEKLLASARGEPLALILAAGGGTRLRPLTDNLPKCLLPVGGRPLLDYQLDALAAAGVSEVLVVTGYRAEQVEQHLAGRARTLVNPAFEGTNNLYSLWVAAGEAAGREFLCLNADLLFHAGLLTSCLESDDDVCVVLDRKMNPEALKAAVEGGRVVEISPSLPRERIFGSFVGMARFARRTSAALPEILDALLEKPGNRQADFTACLPELVARGLAVGYSLTGGLPWIEIDTEDDLIRAESETLPALRQAEHGQTK